MEPTSSTQHQMTSWSLVNSVRKWSQQVLLQLTFWPLVKAKSTNFGLNMWLKKKKNKNKGKRKADMADVCRKVSVLKFLPHKIVRWTDNSWPDGWTKLIKSVDMLLLWIIHNESKCSNDTFLLYHYLLLWSHIPYTTDTPKSVHYLI